MNIVSAHAMNWWGIVNISQISLINDEKSKGPNTEPCGTPEETGSRAESQTVIYPKNKSSLVKIKEPSSTHSPSIYFLFYLLFPANLVSTIAYRTSVFLGFLSGSNYSFSRLIYWRLSFHGSKQMCRQQDLDRQCREYRRWFTLDLHGVFEEKVASF